MLNPGHETAKKLNEYPSMPEGPAGWTSVSVGVGDLDTALALWVDTFGFDLTVLRDGPDEDLARLWGLDAQAIARQALLNSGTSGYGRLHLVEYAEPGPSVRDGAAVFDLLPKNLDIYVDDLPRRFDALKAAGHRFRSDTYSEVTAPDGTVFREIHLAAHDDVNVVLLEIVGHAMNFNGAGFAGIGPLIFISPIAADDKRFLGEVVGFDALSDNLLDGPDVERMIGLPPGAGLDVSIWAKAGNDFGTLEIVDYQGVEGENRYPLARPGARGILHVTFASDDAPALLERARQAGVAIEHVGDGETLVGAGALCRIATPAGLRMEIYAPA